MQGNSPKIIRLGKPLASEEISAPKSPNQATWEELQGLNSVVSRDVPATSKMSDVIPAQREDAVHASSIGGHETAEKEPPHEGDMMV
jgi:hypothetical protein